MITKKEINKLSGLIDVFYKYAQEVANTGVVNAILNAVVEGSMQKVIFPILENAFNDVADEIFDAISAGKVPLDPNQSLKINVKKAAMNNSVNFTAAKNENGQWVVSEVAIGAPTVNVIPSPSPIKSGQNINVSPYFQSKMNAFTEQMKEIIKNGLNKELNSIGNQTRLVGTTITHKGLLANPPAIINKEFTIPKEVSNE